jgi:uncharacterized membrane protein SpoIIM required for sporulation
MLIDIQRFLTQEKPFWDELEAALDRLDASDGSRLGVGDAERLHYLYERVLADLSRLRTFSSERELRMHLEALAARAYGMIHDTRPVAVAVRPGRWIREVFPAAFARHIAAFRLSCAAMLVGCIAGVFALAVNPASRGELMPFRQLMQSPAERVAQEEKAGEGHLRGRKTSGAAFYMTHNTRVALYTAAMGVTWGIGTILLLFSNGVMMGIVAADYVMAGKTTFLVAWLLPHGSVEIPAILIAAQAGLVLAGALLARRSRLPLRARLRAIRADFLTLLLGVALMLVWAGFVEAFLSQYHEPIIPYWFKIMLGAVELVLVCFYLTWAGRAATRGGGAGAAPAGAAARGVAS